MKRRVPVHAEFDEARNYLDAVDMTISAKCVTPDMRLYLIVSAPAYSIMLSWSKASSSQRYGAVVVAFLFVMSAILVTTGLARAVAHSVLANAANGAYTYQCQRDGEYFVTVDDGFCVDFYVLDGPWAKGYPLHMCTREASMHEILFFTSHDTWPCYSDDLPLRTGSTVAINRMPYVHSYLNGDIAIAAFGFLAMIAMVCCLVFMTCGN